jgi:PTH1 family peptidyl-tRNA hydrolase
MISQTAIYLFVGLGNPGSQYDLNRHNIGFMAVDAIAEIWSFPAYKSKFSAKISEGKLGSARVILCKPQTYMNLSGKSIAEACQFYKIPLENVYVFHDDLDLDPGKIKLKKGGGTGGHNGLKSMDQHVGKEYWRIRLGIGHPGIKEAVTGHVLGNFHKRDMEWLTDILALVGKNAPYLLTDTQGEWMNRIDQG